MCKIVVVDDDEIDQLIFEKLLTTFLADVQVVALPSTKGLAERIVSGELNPTFIIVNTDMLAMTSWALLNQFQESGLTVPVYLVSHWLTPADALKATHYSFIKGLLDKPFREKDIRQIALNNNLRFQPYEPVLTNA
jgi:response regulator RpfG family c-di-GMP phosphodiesterase